MTRKDYILIARGFRATYQTACESQQPAVALEAILRSAYSVSAGLAQDNPRFNGKHFMEVIRGAKAVDSRPSRNGVQS